MREAGQNLDTAKRYVLLSSKQRLKIVVHKGRNRYESFEGRVECMYPNVFTVSSEGAGLKTFSYSDVVTRHVKLTPLGEN